MNPYPINTNEKFGLAGIRKSINTNPNFASAVVLNNLVKAFNISNQNLNSSINLANFCLALDSNTEDLLLNYGLKNISPNNPQFIETALVFGKGIVQKDSNYNLPEDIENLLNYTIYDIYQENEDISNCYLMGQINLFYNSGNFDLEFLLAKPVDQNNILIIHKDTKIEDIKNILFFSDEIEFTSSYASFVPLYKFIIDVESLQNERRLDRYFTYLYDIRKPEGLFGLTDENIFSNMINSILNNKKTIEFALNAELQYITNIINAWINLNSWEPSFTGYWQVSENPMPEQLKSFILKYFGIEI